MQAAPRESGLDRVREVVVGVEFDGSKTKLTIMPYKIKVFAPDFLKGDERENFCDEYLKNFTHDGCGLDVI